MTKTRRSYLVMAFLAVAAVGCSDGVRSLSPVGPSPVAEAPAAQAASVAAGWAAANGWSTMADGRVAVADGVAVEAVEVVSDVSGECPSRTITVRGVPVAVTPVTMFAAPLSCATLTAGKTVKITGVLLRAAGGFTVSATHLAVVGGETAPAPAPNRGGEKLAGDGVIGQVSGACPSMSFLIAGYRVEATAGTVYENGDCNSLRDGAQVHLEVDKQPSGAIYVDKVVFLRTPGRRE